MTYVISDTAQGFWQKTNAKTLTGAKIACTREFGAGYNSATLYVGEMDENGQVEFIVRKDNFPGSKWTD